MYPRLLLSLLIPVIFPTLRRSRRSSRFSRYRRCISKGWRIGNGSRGWCGELGTAYVGVLTNPLGQRSGSKVLIAASIERIVGRNIIAKYEFVSARRSVEVKDLILACRGRWCGFIGDNSADGSWCGWFGVALIDVFAIPIDKRSSSKVLVATYHDGVVCLSISDENGIGAYIPVKVKDSSVTRCRCGGDGRR